MNVGIFLTGDESVEVNLHKKHGPWLQITRSDASVVTDLTLYIPLEPTSRALVCDAWIAAFQRVKDSLPAQPTLAQIERGAA